MDLWVLYCDKFEIRISKPETNQKSKTQMFQTDLADLYRQAFLFSPIRTLGFFRISKFEFRICSLYLCAQPNLT